MCIRDRVVDVAVFFVDGIGFTARITGDNTVDQCGTKQIFLADPVHEIIAKLPLCSILEHTFLQFFSVVVDKLAGEDDKALSGF